MISALVLAFAISGFLTGIESYNTFWKARNDVFRSKWFYFYFLLNGIVATALCYGVIQVLSLPKWATGILTGIGWQALLRSNFLLLGQSRPLTVPQGLTTEQELRNILSGVGLEKPYLQVAGFFQRMIDEDLKPISSRLLEELVKHVPAQEIAAKIQTLVLSSQQLDAQAKDTIITKVKAQLADSNVDEKVKRLYLGDTLMTHGGYRAVREIVGQFKPKP